MQIQENRDLRAWNSFALHCRARAYAAIESVTDLVQALDHARRHSLPILVLGGGSNVLLPEVFPGMVLHIRLLGIETRETDRNTVMLKAAAGENWHQLVQYCLNNSLYGIENLALIPGTVGAAPIQNIGAYGVELEEFFVSLEAMDLASGEVQSMDKAACRFAYRDSIFKQALKGRMAILGITLELERAPKLRTDYQALAEELKNHHPPGQLTARELADTVCRIRRRKLPDPQTLPNAGSFFKNPEVETQHYQQLAVKFPGLPGFPVADPARTKIPAAWLLENCGWKGRRLGDAGVHAQQALVIVNHGGADQAQILGLATAMRESVSATFGITLETEVCIIGA